MALPNYSSALDYLFGRLDYERTPQRARSLADFRLARMDRLLELLDHPQQTIPAVHIAGTKGKGSTSTMVARILEEANYRTGLFTSPHMVRFEERMTVQGREPQPQELVELVNCLAEAVNTLEAEGVLGSPTFFELATALGWLYFRQQQAQIAVMEVGLGGRLDSTNLCHPVVTAITSISRDHTRLLGETLGEIAREKAGIIKPHIPVVVGEMPAEPFSVIAEVAAQASAPRYAFHHEFEAHWTPIDPLPGPRPVRYAVTLLESGQQFGPFSLAMPGEHQARNAAVAMGIVQKLQAAGFQIDDGALRRGLARAHCPLRTEVRGEQPLLIIDAAHNPASIAAVCDTLRSIQARRRILVFAASRDKEVLAMLQQLAPQADLLIVTRFLNNPRAVPVEELEELARHSIAGEVRAAESPQAALHLASQLAAPEDLICVTGSFFLAAEARELTHQHDLDRL